MSDSGVHHGAGSPSRGDHSALNTDLGIPDPLPILAAAPSTWRPQRSESGKARFTPPTPTGVRQVCSRKKNLCAPCLQKQQMNPGLLVLLR